jgi:hypothetical protein
MGPKTMAAEQALTSNSPPSSHGLLQTATQTTPTKPYTNPKVIQFQATPTRQDTRILCMTRRKTFKNAQDDRFVIKKSKADPEDD